MKHSYLGILGMGVALWTSCAAPCHHNSKPVLEVEQVLHRWEIVVRLHDLAATANPRCGIFVLMEDGQGNKVEGHLADLRLNKTEENGSFIGIYSNGKEFPHGTEVVAMYRRRWADSPVRGASKMFYH